MIRTNSWTLVTHRPRTTPVNSNSSMTFLLSTQWILYRGSWTVPIHSAGMHAESLFQTRTWKSTTMLCDNLSAIHWRATRIVNGTWERLTHLCGCSMPPVLRRLAQCGPHSSPAPLVMPPVHNVVIRICMPSNRVLPKPILEDSTPLKICRAEEIVSQWNIDRLQAK